MFSLLDSTELLLENESVGLCWVSSSRLGFNTLPGGWFIAVNLFLQTFPIFYETTCSPLSRECHQNHSILDRRRGSWHVGSERPRLWCAAALSSVPSAGPRAASRLSLFRVQHCIAAHSLSVKTHPLIKVSDVVDCEIRVFFLLWVFLFVCLIVGGSIKRC